MKWILLACLSSSLAFGQLVEAPPSNAGAPSSPKGHKAAGQAKAKPEAPDLLDNVKFPKAFEGALIDKKSGRVTFNFVGEWDNAPAIQGGSSTIAYSRKGAVLHDFLNPGTAAYFLYSFNIGKKNGQLMARSFKWKKNPYIPGPGEGVVQDGEGPGTLSGGVYTFDLDQFQLLLKALPKTGWAPASTSLALWNASEFQTELPPSHKIGEYAKNSDKNLQYVPVWTCGSLVTISDGFLSKTYFRFFGGALTYVIPAVKVADNVYAAGATSHCDGEKVAEGGHEPMGALWDNGLQVLTPSAWHADYKISFRFSKDFQLSSIATSGKWNGTQSLTSELAGTATPVAIPAAMASEILDRSREAGWATSAGPYSLKRALQGAFKGLKLMAPTPAVCLDGSKGQLNPSSNAFNNDSLNPWKAAKVQWAADAEAAGAQLLVPDKRELGRTGWRSPAPCGRILPAGGTGAAPSSPAPDPSL